MANQDEPFWQDLCSALSTAFVATERVTGGDICQAFRLSTDKDVYFVKRLPAARRNILQAEFDSLQALNEAGEVKVPQPLLVGADNRWSYLILEHLALGQRSDQTDAALGQQLAALHRHRADQHGWPVSNWIGLTSQPNQPSADWCHFFKHQRLAHQLKLLKRQVRAPGLLRACDKLLERFDMLLGKHQPEPSLLHGDLWGGNYAALSDATPVIFDPASYYGDRETDLAMSRLFGGFGPTFYAAYQAEWPLPEGFQQRQDLYQLYHVLNHANLFGSGYVQQAARLVDRILSS